MFRHCSYTPLGSGNLGSAWLGECRTTSLETSNQRSILRAEMFGFVVFIDTFIWLFPVAPHPRLCAKPGFSAVRCNDEIHLRGLTSILCSTSFSKNVGEVFLCLSSSLYALVRFTALKTEWHKNHQLGATNLARQVDHTGEGVATTLKWDPWAG